MPGELKPRRRRRGGRGRGRHRVGTTNEQQQVAPDGTQVGAVSSGEFLPGDVEGNEGVEHGEHAGQGAEPLARGGNGSEPPAPIPVAASAPRAMKAPPVTRPSRATARAAQPAARAAQPAARAAEPAAASGIIIRSWPNNFATAKSAADPASAVSVPEPPAVQVHVGEAIAAEPVGGEAIGQDDTKDARGRTRRKRAGRGRAGRAEPRGRRRSTRGGRGADAATSATPAGETASALEPGPNPMGEAGAAVAEVMPHPSAAEALAPAPRPRHREHHGTEKTIVINAAPQETRVAILEKGVLAEIFIERESSRTVVGNIYKGRVTKVLPGMQSAFVALGLERDAFLYVSDISPGYDAYEGLLDLDEVEGGEEIREAAPKIARDARIEDLIKEGQELLVQVTKEPIGTKGARITSYVTMPGRFLVLMPQVEHVGVSRKIGDARERSRLRKILDKVRQPGMGFIVRTVADGCDAEELTADALYLTSIWEEIRKKAERISAPAEAHRELSIVPKVLRDMLNPGVTKVIVDNEETHRQALDLIMKLLPDFAPKLHHYREPFPIFEKYGVQAELDKALKSRVWLKSGGYIVINQTEALVAIDVNTGKFVGKRNLEDTVLKTNLEAVSEIVRQLRLRDLGGIIVVDFIDMEERKSKRKLIEAFEKELQKDRARTKVLNISDFGLVEITRQRTKKSLERILCRTCPYCAGAGKIKASATVLFEIQRELQKLAPSLDGKRLVIRANPEVAQELVLDKRLLTAGIASLELVDMSIRADSTLHHEQFDIISL